MTSHGASGKPWKPKVTLESYLNLEHMDAISPHMLRKILTIHGFKSFNVPKDDLLDAVRSIELMDAHHSTLQSDVSSNAFLSLNDVIRDLSLLHWQECCITNIETINSVTDFGEEPLPKRLKTNCNRNTVVNGPDTFGLQKQIINKNSTMGRTSTKRSDRVKKSPTKWKDFVMGADTVDPLAISKAKQERLHVYSRRGKGEVSKSS
ncbi:hypothetical protein HanXRQr2_Chr16g0775381 [Helianthus annuus]|uniref:DUF7787 domain-containing protein n=2 Tax=Helianthus annuus TaxID=4232 RepID=A0A9K3DVG9_HELAN|nr:uncharacterized protein LOC110915276 [Helianthus annuus]XP_022015639.1 uncharacterized protein LOC110915276 [Helianthus annuus]XP_022015640.1 uncharacterized protein LOC110915276 [Helianthus annuus]KAF5762322.1 hypothetical protein HanXRQr2_Chr16g0775381 [Helianthus annuus]